MSGELVLNREAMRVVERNDRGIVTYRKRYKQGDVVDTSHIDSAQVENLQRSGALVERAAYDAEGAPRNPDGEAPALQTVANPSHQGEPVSDEEHEASYDVDGEEAEFGDSDEATQEDAGGRETEEDAEAAAEANAEDAVDPYAEMDYATLRSTAKDKGLDASGSADDLRTRLREADAS